MGIEAFGHVLSDICEGVSEITKGRSQPLPLKETRFDIDVNNGLATIKTTRTFLNERDTSIEALLTFPVPFDAVLTGLKANIDGRQLTSVAKSRNEARETYEEAIDQGKMAILHEEPLRGVHMLSIGQLGSKKTVSIETEMVMALTDHAGMPFLRIPLTVGEVYGTSPLLPSDGLLTEYGLKMSGILQVTDRSGQVKFANGNKVENGVSIPLNKSIELLFPDMKFGAVEGFDAWGRSVSINLKQPISADQNIDIAILLDRSGSTSEAVGQNGKTIRCVIEDAVRNAIQQFLDKDRISIWEFDDDARLIAEGYVSELRKNVIKFTDIANGTEIGRSIDTVIKHRPSAVIVLTDGQTYAAEAQTAATLGYPISAVLVGPGSLDAMIGHLAASTGGQVFAAAEDDARSALLQAIKGFRRGALKFKGKSSSNRPQSLTTARSGTEIEVLWNDNEGRGQTDSVGRYAMALAMSLFDEKLAGELAVAHGLVTHLTSLIIVDEIGEKANKLPETVKIPLPAVNAIHSLSSSFIQYDMGSMPKTMMNAMINAKFSVNSSMMRDTLNEKSPDEKLQYFNELMADYLTLNTISINWDTLASNFDNDDFDWPSQIIDLIEQLEDNIEIYNLAEDIGLSIEVLATLYFAIRDQKVSRNAARVYRKISSEFAPWLKSLVEEKLS